MWCFLFVCLFVLGHSLQCSGVTPALHSGISSEGAWEITWDARTQFWSSYAWQTSALSALLFLWLLSVFPQRSIYPESFIPDRFKGLGEFGTIPIQRVSSRESKIQKGVPATNNLASMRGCGWPEARSVVRL